MKIILKTHKDHVEVIVRDDSGMNLYVFVFNTIEEAKAFSSGFQTCKSVINRLVQSLPFSYTKND